MPTLLNRRSLLLSGMSALGYPGGRAAPPPSRPNIVWIVGDDLGVELGCYGYLGVATPNIDRLASQSTRFTNCHSTAPICSPSRSAYQTGVYQTTTGTHHHRSHRQDGYRLPAPVTMIADQLHEAGYFTANLRRVSDGLTATAKTDFNFLAARPFDGAHWRERNTPAQPFFAQVNLQPPHKGPAFAAARRQQRLVDPARVALPPYYPDHPVIRDEVANYLDAVQLADAQVGEVLRTLDQDGVLDSTIVFLFGDNGRCLLRAKQWLYEPGTHVPLLVRFPGGNRRAVRDDLCTLLDMTASTLAAAGLPRPQWMHGAPLFNTRESRRRDAIYTARDRSGIAVDRIRAIRTPRHRLIHNQMPERPYDQPNAYIATEYPTLSVLRDLHRRGQLNAAQSLFLAPRKPEFELYDLRRDPHEVHNLAEDRAAQPLLADLRRRLAGWAEETHDRGSLPEDPDELRQARADDAAYGKNTRAQ